MTWQKLLHATILAALTAETVRRLAGLRRILPTA
jgi:hypothetical protein